MGERKFKTNVKELKYKVLKEVIRYKKYGNLDKAMYSIPRNIIPGPTASVRCCIYYERAVIEERVKMAMGGNKENDNVLEVIDIACDGCTLKKYSATNACRGCVAHKCQLACPVGAISFENKKAVIDHDKCIECGRCMKACPFNAIIETKRPCVASCPTKAITIDINNQKKAVIQNEKCIQCGACLDNCPFGAITDKSYVIDILNILEKSENRKNYSVYAVVAPSIASQFSFAKQGQVISGLKKLGFDYVVEAALGADYVAKKEAKELVERGFLTSSCCPSFVKYIENEFPDMSEHISDNDSPMIETAKQIRNSDENAKVVFIGPCISKKMEVKKDECRVVDYVLTFEELLATFDAMDICLETLPEENLEDASSFGRGFAKSGGLAKAVEKVLEDENIDFDLNAEVCNGITECKVALLRKSKDKLDKNFIEGMSCKGGCVGGCACSGQ